MKILLVDDNEDLANNLADILLESGYPASIAFDGKSAIEPGYYIPSLTDVSIFRWNFSIFECRVGLESPRIFAA